MKNALYLIPLIFLLSSPLFYIPLDEGGGFVHFPPPDSSGGVAASVASEEENIDTFDVHPGSGRWTIDADEQTDLVDDSLYVIDDVNNDSSESDFFINRGLSKTDGKTDYRMKAEGGGNQTEYFRDVIGDRCDFEEGDDEEWDDIDASSSVANGIIIIVPLGPYDGIEYTFNYGIGQEVYTDINIRIRAEAETTLYLTWFLDGNIVHYDYTNVIKTDWEVWNEPLDYYMFDKVQILTQIDNTAKLFIDYIEIIGDLDFATHIESEVEDTWDWEDSSEYWYDVESNVSDFNDGTIEDWTLTRGDTLNVTDDGWLWLYDDANDFVQIDTAGLTIDSTTYAWFTLEFFWNSSDGNDWVRVDFLDSGDNIIGNCLDDVEANTKTLISIDFDLDGDWAGVETAIKIKHTLLNPFDNINIFMNMTYLYDCELGDVEGFDRTSGAALDYQYVNPEGYISVLPNTDLNYINWAETGLSIDSAVFTYGIVRMRVNEIGLRYAFYGGTLLEDYNVATSTDWFIHEVDLTLDDSWSGIETGFGLSLPENSGEGNFDGNERFDIDYILLLGHWAETKSTIGFYDEIDEKLLVNVSTVFNENNTQHYEVLLLDVDEEISYSYTSEVFDDVSDFWVEIKITFDVFRSNFIAKASADNGTRIFSVTFPQDFTEESGRVPALFFNEKAPSIFVSNFLPGYSWLRTTLDYIKADFKERQWVQVDTPSDSDYLYDAWDHGMSQDGCADTSQWELTVPYLDSVSGIMTMSTNGSWDCFNVGQEVSIAFYIYGVEASTGTSHLLFGVKIYKAKDVSGTVYDYFYFGINNSVGHEYSSTDNATPSSSFSISLREDRTILSAKARFYKNRSELEIFQDQSAELDLTTFVTPLSHEFILRTYHSHYHGAAAEDVVTLFEDFGFIERDIFEDVVNAIVEPLGNFFQTIFVGLFRFIADIFRTVGDGLGVFILGVTSAVTALQTALTTAIASIQGWLTTLGTTITTAIGQIETWLTTIATTISNAIGDIEGWLTTIATTITDAVGDIAEGIWTAFGSAASDIMDDIITALTSLAGDVADFLDAVIQAVIPFLQALAADLAQLFFDIAEELIALGGDILAGIIAFVAGAIFFLWDALGLPDLLAIVDVLLTGFVQFVTGLPQFITDWVNYLTAISGLFVLLGFIWVFVLPIAIAPTAGGCLEKIIDHALIDLSGGLSLLGFRIPIPFVIPWGILLIFTMLSDTVFFGFF